MLVLCKRPCQPKAQKCFRTSPHGFSSLPQYDGFTPLVQLVGRGPITESPASVLARVVPPSVLADLVQLPVKQLNHYIMLALSQLQQSATSATSLNFKAAEVTTDTPPDSTSELPFCTIHTCQQKYSKMGHASRPISPDNNFIG